MTKTKTKNSKSRINRDHESQLTNVSTQLREAKNQWIVWKDL